MAIETQRQRYELSRERPAPQRIAWRRSGPASPAQRLVVRLLLWLAVAVAAIPAIAAENDAREVVERFHGTLLAVMKDADRLGFDGRYKRLQPAVVESFDLPGIARLVTGKYWSEFDDRQKSQFVETFSRLSVATYALRFDGYSGESFKTVSEERSANGDAIVHTVLVKSNGEAVRLDYVLRRIDGRPRVINVIADGVSDLALKRAEYVSIMRSEGFNALVAKLNDKIARYSAGKG